MDLPPEQRPVGPTLSHRLGPGDLGLLLFEAAPVWGVPFDRSVYRIGKPRTFSAGDFRPHRTGSGRTAPPGEAGRHFDLFVESGSSRATSLRLVQLNELVRSLAFEKGDFYPGRAAPARFRPARGWTTTHSGTVVVGPSTYSVSLASTVRYRDELDQFPPHRTLERLPKDGIVIRVSLSADNRHPPTVREGDRRRPILRVGGSTCGLFKGAPPRVLTCRLRAWRPHQYQILG